MSIKEEILLELEPLFEKAEKEKLWFHCSYQDLWFSPKDLKNYQKQGRFIWGVDNWTLRNPMEKAKELNNAISSLEFQKEELLKNIKEEI